jgi:hypothetical protein
MLVWFHEMPVPVMYLPVRSGIAASSKTTKENPLAALLGENPHSLVHHRS